MSVEYKVNYRQPRMSFNGMKCYEYGDKEIKTMIRKYTDSDFDRVHFIINDAAIAYKGHIPDDRWHEPYMSKEELKEQISEGIIFSCYIENDKIIGVMGIQEKTDVCLIRHAYVLTTARKHGIGTQLLRHLVDSCTKPVLIGTWTAAEWAIRFYEKNGFVLVSDDEKNTLLKKYWGVPSRQIETSVVLKQK